MKNMQVLEEKTVLFETVSRKNKLQIYQENLHVSQNMPYFARKIQKSRLIWIRK